MLASSFRTGNTKAKATGFFRVEQVDGRWWFVDPDGHLFFVAENPQGLIIDWEFFRESAPADPALLPRSVGRMEQAYGQGPEAIVADRGFDSLSNQLGITLVPAT